MQQLRSQLQEVLQKVFGLSEFRPGQAEAITALMTQGRVLCILPTGYGKSLLYQLPACLLRGVTIVISPLLALMRDQIHHLNQRFKIPAMAINSDQSEEENARAKQAALHGKVKILFIAPEQLDHIDRFNFFLHLDINLVVIDEAHCISSWGHDFRPSYRQILHFLHAICAKNKEVKVLGLTATANNRVEMDIKKQLFPTGEGLVIRQSMNRPNIRLSVINTNQIATKLATCETLLRKLEGCGLIYCATRENTELVADFLQSRGLNVVSYHAGYEVEDKRKLQQEFVSDKYKALAATNALGMGIDKGNLCFIIHFDVPGSITAYYQEVGRCGRDGQKAEGILLYDVADNAIQHHFINSATPSLTDFQTVLKTIEEAPESPGLLKIKSLSGLHPTRVTTVLAELVEQGFISKYSNNGKQVYHLTSKKDTLDLSRYDTQHQVKTQDLHQMTSYASERRQCRMKLLRMALGDQEAQGCGHCDCCSQSHEKIEIPQEKMSHILSWIDQRPLSIAPMVKEKVSEGMSILDSKLRSPLFKRFMKERTSFSDGSFEIDPALFDLIKKHLQTITRKEPIAEIVVIPSKTWKARDQFAQALGKHLGVPVFTDLLQWDTVPPKRQGELLNNDQRRDNVSGRMKAFGSLSRGAGAILLLDDYIGSGNTVREAARALRAARVNKTIVPFTIVALKWHLGKAGFV